jgi:hypothetical protein
MDIPRRFGRFGRAIMTIQANVANDYADNLRPLQ